MYAVLCIASDYWSSDGCAEVGYARGSGADGGDVCAVLETWDVGVVLLKDTEAEGKTPKKGFEDEGGEKETPCWAAAVDGG